MITIWFGSIPLGSNTLSGPVLQDIERQNTFAEYAVTRGKPVLHDIGSELDLQHFDFFFSEEFCNPASELAKLEAAFALKTPLPLMFGDGVYVNKRYVVESLSIGVVKTNRSGGVIRVEASISLKESPVMNLLGLIHSIARGRAPAVRSRASGNPNVRKSS